MILFGSAERRRPWPLRAHLVVFAAAIVLPILAFAGFASWQYADGERSRLEQAALEEARDVAQAVDDELGNLLSSAQILALTSAVRNGHLEEFHRLAQDMQQALSIIAVLRKPDGQQVASPLAPFGTSLPRNQLPTDQAVLSSKQPQVTDLYTGAVSRVPLFSVTVPVIQAGDIVYLLNLSFPVERLRSIILREQPPRTGRWLWLTGAEPSWHATIAMRTSSESRQHATCKRTRKDVWGAGTVLPLMEEPCLVPTRARTFQTGV
ncbi:cache domain-containing protein [Microvirga aerilata]|uniref:cache domain-containing protein n=1 Tax=Microvirga aerilata TaxID=670292 RepID=UPI00364430A0